MANSSSAYQAYYTKSTHIVNYMVGMLNINRQDSILEPCGGDGVFVDEILKSNSNARIDVLELNPDAVTLMKNKYKHFLNINIKETDTLTDADIISCKKKYDKIIGNPPYGARYNNDKKDLLNSLYPQLYTKESYTLFLYSCIQCLKEDGELCFIIPDTFLSLHRHETIRKFILLNTKIIELALFPSSFFPGIKFGYANLCIITLRKSNLISANLGNDIKIRTNFNNVSDLTANNAGHIEIVNQKKILDNVGSAFMFNADAKIIDLINDNSISKIGDLANCVTGFYSGDDKKYLHPINANIKNAKKYRCANPLNIRQHPLTETEIREGIASSKYLVPIVKGGNIEFMKPDIWFMNWSMQAVKEFKSSKKCRFQNADYYFKEGIAIPMIRSSKLTGALIGCRLFDQSIVGVFPKDSQWTKYLLGFFNSAVCTDLINAINPSTNNSANYLKKIPFIIPNNIIKSKVEEIIDEIIDTIKSGQSNITDLKANLDNIFYCLYFYRQGEEKHKRIFKHKNQQPIIPELFD